jgi:hypothetical protein
MEIVSYKTVRFETTPISVLNCNTSTQVASTGNLPPSFLTLAYNPYRLPEMDLAFRLECRAIFWTNLGNACTVILLRIICINKKTQRLLLQSATNIGFSVHMYK